MIDSHCHFDFESFDKDREYLLQNCKERGVNRILIPGVSERHWQNQIQLCERSSELVFALGTHPYFLKYYNSSSLEKLDTFLTRHREKVVAVGEIGLDHYLSKQPDGPDESLQQTVFEEQLELAKRHELPVIIHHRQSHNPIIRTLKRMQFELGGVIHAFSGSLQEAQSYIDLGFMLGAGGTITYERAVKTRRVFKSIGLEHILLETDAPDMPLYGYQGQRNNPLRIVEVAHCLSELKNMSVHQISQQTDENFYRLFSHA